MKPFYEDYHFLASALALLAQKIGIYFGILKMMINFKFVWTLLHCKEVLLVDGLLSSTFKLLNVITKTIETDMKWYLLERSNIDVI